MSTSDDKVFLKLWHEVDFSKIGFGICSKSETFGKYKWFPLLKGGEYRKWFGNQNYIVNWHNDGEEIKKISNIKYPYLKGNLDFVLGGQMYYFKPGFTWSALTSGRLGIRQFENGFIFNTKGQCYFPYEEGVGTIIMALFNSNVANRLLQFIAPTLDYTSGVISKLFLTDKLTKSNKDELSRLASENVKISKMDWDSFETSWGFLSHPLIGEVKHISEAFNNWKIRTNQVRATIKENEERINNIIAEAYDMSHLVSSVVDEKDITLHQADTSTDIRSLVSYAVGCMFGRYSLDVEGLAYAGGDWKEAYATKYKTFIPDEDAIIPITDEEYFKDDIVARFVDFIRVVYGEETLEENLKFIADALGNKGDTSRAVIRNYFLNDFYKDHCSTYSVTGSGKRPIYWLFDSGKQNGFKALIYIHRYTPDTVGLIRSVYLHNAQAAIQNSLQNSEYIISTTTSATERARETRKKDKYVKQLNELRPYYQALSHIALQRITMDLDDGVKKNYQLFQGVEVSTEGKKKQTINLLAKI